MGDRTLVILVNDTINIAARGITIEAYPELVDET